ncbi:uncharacterized protein LAESUDRAFT_746318 [Laetiporus sulphureus 93-53]|uniref:Uncharacterized protein n=1 Tax=Laetiporus sulphureus 93-53 TaxID=1314785 RepID=A0A165IC21_9APHY|nr:uncharacterized protein LAESUDRAFT_746318 [Laetiporus sulphureus 93-53]KZT12873.1 hypothetical protein LAESUDRAFT_746318 [Laetiporus sulphureus 93-53]
MQMKLSFNELEHPITHYFGRQQQSAKGKRKSHDVEACNEGLPRKEAKLKENDGSKRSSGFRPKGRNNQRDPVVSVYDAFGTEARTLAAAAMSSDRPLSAFKRSHDPKPANMGDLTIDLTCDEDQNICTSRNTPIESSSKASARSSLYSRTPVRRRASSRVAATTSLPTPPPTTAKGKPRIRSHRWSPDFEASEHAPHALSPEPFVLLPSPSSSAYDSSTHDAIAAHDDSAPSTFLRHSSPPLKSRCNGRSPEDHDKSLSLYAHRDADNIVNGRHQEDIARSKFIFSSPATPTPTSTNCLLPPPCLQSPRESPAAPRQATPRSTSSPILPSTFSQDATFVPSSQTQEILEGLYSDTIVRPPQTRGMTRSLHEDEIVPTSQSQERELANTHNIFTTRTFLSYRQVVLTSQAEEEELQIPTHHDIRIRSTTGDVAGSRKVGSPNDMPIDIATSVSRLNMTVPVDLPVPQERQSSHATPPVGVNDHMNDRISYSSEKNSNAGCAAKESTDLLLSRHAVDARTSSDELASQIRTCPPSIPMSVNESYDGETCDMDEMPTPLRQFRDMFGSGASLLPSQLLCGNDVSCTCDVSEPGQGRQIDKEEADSRTDSEMTSGSDVVYAGQGPPACNSGDSEAQAKATQVPNENVHLVSPDSEAPSNNVLVDDAARGRPAEAPAEQVSCYGLGTDDEHLALEPLPGDMILPSGYTSSSQGSSIPSTIVEDFLRTLDRSQIQSIPGSSQK